MNKNNTIICAAKKCYSSRVTHPCKSFFGFPSDISVCKIWLENCGRTDLNAQQASRRSCCKLCEDHFEDKWFTDCSKKVLRRKLNPIPTIFHNNISSLLPSGIEPDPIDDDDCTLNPADLLSEELVEEGNDLCGDSTDLEELSLENQQLPISYYSNEVLKSMDFSEEPSINTLLNHNPESELHKIDQMCRFCMDEITCNYVEMFAETDDAEEIRKVSEIILQNEISVCDSLPHKVCQQCTEDLKMCWRLIEKFRQSDGHLRAIAKDSLFIENEDTTEIRIDEREAEDKINYDNFITPTPKIAMDFPLIPTKEISEESYGSLDEINIDAPLEEENCLNIYKYVILSNNSNNPENSSWQERSINEDTANKLSSNPKKRKQNLNRNSKFHKRYRKILPRGLKNEIVFLTQSHLNPDPGVVTACQTFNYGIDNPIENIIFTGHKCMQCSELVNSENTLEQHVKDFHEQ